MRPNLGQFDSKLGAAGDRVLRLAGLQIHRGIVVAVGQDRLSRSRAMRGLPASHSARDGGHHPVADLFEVDDVRSVQYREMYDEASGAM